MAVARRGREAVEIAWLWREFEGCWRREKKQEERKGAVVEAGVWGLGLGLGASGGLGLLTAG